MITFNKRPGDWNAALVLGSTAIFGSAFIASLVYNPLNDGVDPVAERCVIAGAWAVCLLASMFKVKK